MRRGGEEKRGKGGGQGRERREEGKREGGVGKRE